PWFTLQSGIITTKSPRTRPSVSTALHHYAPRKEPRPTCGAIWRRSIRKNSQLPKRTLISSARRLFASSLQTMLPSAYSSVTSFGISSLLIHGRVVDLPSSYTDANSLSSVRPRSHHALDDRNSPCNHKPTPYRKVIINVDP
ncbi:hypothetical protein PMAYCL1PPCAC_02022, partial [Pristionchus mayeri]